MRVLFILIFVTFSCSFHPARDYRRFPTSSQAEKLTRILSYGLDHIKDYQPLRDDLYHFDQWQDDPQSSYEKLGLIDRYEVKGTLPFIVSRNRDHRNFYKRLPLAKQISFEKWQSLSEPIMSSFEKGHHVFRYEGKLYTLFGVELNENNLHANTNIKMDRYIERISKLDLMWHFFNGYDYVKLEDEIFLELPRVKRVSQNFLKLVRLDATSQVPELEYVEIESLLNYRKGTVALKQGEWRDYFASKEQSYRDGPEVSDSNVACDTRVYFPALKKRSILFKYIQTLLNEKSKLMHQLNFTNNQYNELMAVAIGVLLIESKMGHSLKYMLKEYIQLGSFNPVQSAISWAKEKKGRTDNNSRGLTQIKDLFPFVKNTPYEYLVSFPGDSVRFISQRLCPIVGDQTH